MIHTVISQLALDRAKTILENSDFWSGPAAANTSAQAVTVLRALGGDAPKEDTTKAEKPAPAPAPAPVKPSPKADESKPADV